MFLLFLSDRLLDLTSQALKLAKWQSLRAGGLVSGEAVGACANELIANAREKMETRMNLFIVDDLTVGCV